jgi:hypothetical protein
MSSDEFVFRGEIEETPLASMLATVHRYGVPGAMELTHGGVTKRIFFAGGDVIFASSSDRSESLGDHLLRTGVISETQYRVSSEGLASSTGVRHGEILVQMGFLDPGQLGGAVREQVQAILWSLFNWEEGRVTFRVGTFRDDEVYKIKISTPRAILTGCRRIADPKVITTKLGGRGVVFKRLSRPPRLEGFQLDDDERRLVEMVNGKRTLFDLCEEGPLSAGGNARVLYALTELQLVTPDSEASGGIKIQLRS